MKLYAICGSMFVVASLLLTGCNSEKSGLTNSQAKKRSEEIKALHRVVVELKQQVEQLHKLASKDVPPTPKLDIDAVQPATFLETSPGTRLPHSQTLKPLNPITEWLPQRPPTGEKNKRLYPTINNETQAILKQALAVQQKKLSIIANNIANVDTVAFKSSRLVIESSYYRHDVLPGALDESGNPTAIGVSMGLGCRISGVQINFNQGAFQQTGNSLDVAIEGNGFFQVIDPNGDTLYTRAGNFSINANGALVLGSANTGRLLEPAITIPADTTGIVIDASGTVSVKQPNNTQLSTIGTLTLASFVNPEGLLKLGENLYSETDASGTATIGNPGLNGIGKLRQNMLELSNVEQIRELLAWRETEQRLRILHRLLGISDFEATE